jgi:sporulation protein YlmC with PRC-barrel domain
MHEAVKGAWMMAYQPTRSNNDLLSRIYEGMEVYDSDGEKIGKVERVQFGQEDTSKPGVESATVSSTGERDTLFDNLAEVFTDPDAVPEELRARLLRYGYIKIDTGLLKSDRYVESTQIAGVVEDHVNLHVTRDELLDF